MVCVRSVCGAEFKLEQITPVHTVKQLKVEIRDKLGVEEEYQLLTFNGNKLNKDSDILQDFKIQNNSNIILQYDLDGTGDDNALCYICCIIKVQGGGCGCCPVKRWGFCWEEWPEEETDEEKGNYKITCSLM